MRLLDPRSDVFLPPSPTLTEVAEPLYCEPLTDNLSVEQCLVSVSGQYHELALRHSGLVKYIEGVTKRD